MKRLLLSLWLTCAATAACIPPPNTYDYEAQVWTGGAGAYSASAYRAGTVFMQQAKWWGLRPLLGRVNLYLGNDTNGLCKPIIRDWYTISSQLDGLRGFTAADFSESTGLTGDTTTKCLGVNGVDGAAGNSAWWLKLSDWTVATNVHMATYVRTGTNEATYLLGTQQNPPTYYLTASFANISYADTGLAFASAPDTNGVGLYMATRRSTTDFTYYKNGSILCTNATSDTTAISSIGMIVHAFNTAGVPGGHTSRTLSYYAFGFSIPDSLAQPYYKMVQNVQITMGRQK